MSQFTVWHNPSCSKSRAARDELGADATLRLYKEDPPTEAEIVDVLAKLGAEPWDITRFSEKAAAEIGIGDWKRDAGTRDAWIAALADNPILIQRPIVMRGDRAVVAREPGWRDRLK
ncbi:MAG TPA: ArsC/Spx/MgsR family protein [Stackebrandtia sp.]|uniref:ArsC/Spx/MgsR family protein n=1 Tax=Stackebrandtia sp. TaxID=2023065 RepID=UPI002D4D5055|nr:ArsC/Spx/MgsR family protein [Stackebrandtia sp.]HZE37231.1 ArsC/Spx/MgsR family protein [Stackebrandtia sp.]